MIVEKSTRSVMAQMLLRELSDGFQYVEIPDGEITCPNCKGKKEVEIEIPNNAVDPMSPQEVNEDGFTTVIQTCGYCGGVGVVPDYIRASEIVGSPKDEVFLDDIGIEATRLNARILISALKDVYPVPAIDFEEALTANYPIVIMGGTHAGHTTDAVAAMLAERVKASKLIIATNIDGVYSSDPKKDKNAKKFNKITPKELIKITISGETKAGQTSVVDPLACKIISRSKIPTFVLDGKDLKSFENAINGNKFKGTIVG